MFRLFLEKWCYFAKTIGNFIVLYAISNLEIVEMNTVK